MLNINNSFPLREPKRVSFNGTSIPQNPEVIVTITKRESNPFYRFLDALSEHNDKDEMIKKLKDHFNKDSKDVNKTNNKLDVVV